MAVVVAGRPAAAAMTLVFRTGQGAAITCRQEGSRVRVENPTGKDEGEALIVDLETKEHVVVYDGVKAYFDVGKSLSLLGEAAEKAGRGRPQAGRRRPAASYRPLHETKIVNGFSCDMHQRVVAGRVSAEICFVSWGDAIGPKGDYAWFDAVLERLDADIAGESWRPALPRPDEKAPGLAIWTSSIEEDGTRDVAEVLTISRDPLPAAMFHVPSDYKQLAKPLAASERTRGAPPSTAGASTPDAATSSARKISGTVAILLAVVVLFGLLIHAAILHLAANVILNQPRFRQALVAAVIVWVVMLVTGLLHLPSVLGISVGAFVTFGALKISYGASIGRTLALCVVSGLIAALVGYAAAIFFA
jgi:hypothetical protein